MYKLHKIANENIFYLKGVCKVLTEDSILFSLDNETLFEVLSYLKFKGDIASHPAATISANNVPLVEDVTNLAGNSVEENLDFNS